MLSEYLPFALIMLLYGAALGYAFVKLTEYISEQVSDYAYAVIISITLVALCFMCVYNITA